MKSNIPKTLTPKNFKSRTHRVFDTKPIDVGTMGAIYRAENTLSGERVCIKLSAPNSAAVKKMNHRGLSQADSVAKEAGHGSAFLITSRPYVTLDGISYTEMQELNGNFGNYLENNRGNISPEQRNQLLKDLTQGLVDQHQLREETHGDIKAQNILIGKRIKGLDRLVLADTGNASAIDSETAAPRDNVGHWSTTAPELTNPKSRPSLETDFYSAGAVMYQIITGKLPLENILNQVKDAREFLRNTPIQDLVGYIRSDIDQNCPNPFREMFYSLLHPDASFRPHDDEQFQKTVGKGISKYEKSKPWNKVKRWGAGLAAGLALAGAVAYGVHTQGRIDNLSKDVKQRTENASRESRLSNVKRYLRGESGRETTEAISLKAISGWEEILGDKKTAIAAYLNPELVWEIIQDNKTTNYDKILPIIEEKDRDLHFALNYRCFNDHVDNFVWQSSARQAMEYAFKDATNAYANTLSNRAHQAELQRKVDGIMVDYRGQTSEMRKEFLKTNNASPAGNIKK